MTFSPLRDRTGPSWLPGGMGAGLTGFPKVWPALAGQSLGLRAPPSRDPGMVAGHEHFRDGPALEELGSGVVRILEKAIPEALLGLRGLFAHDSGQEPHAGVDKDKGRDLAA